MSDFVTPWTAAYQAPPLMGFSRQEYWSRVPLPSASNTSTPGKCPQNDLAVAISILYQASEMGSEYLKLICFICLSAVVVSEMGKKLKPLSLVSLLGFDLAVL